MIGRKCRLYFCTPSSPTDSKKELILEGHIRLRDSFNVAPAISTWNLKSRSEHKSRQGRAKSGPISEVSLVRNVVSYE